MVFVFIPPKGAAVEPTREEAELMAELDRRGVPAQDFESALTASGVPPDRAAQLVKLGGPRSAGDRARAIATTVFWVVIALFIGLGERPLRRWLREEYPGWEWVAELVVPAFVVAVFLWTLLSRLRAARKARESVTRADQIENKPIG